MPSWFIFCRSFFVRYISYQLDSVCTQVDLNMDVEKPATTSALHQEIQVEDQLAHLALQEDHQTSKLQTIKTNPWAFAWCLFAVWTVLLVSFENQASGNILGIPEFRKDFGTLFNGDYVLSAKWQSAFSGAPVAS